MNNSIKSILLNTKNIVIIGASTNPDKDSFKVILVNSQTSNEIIYNITCH